MDTKYILPEDRKKYGDFCLHHFIGLARSRKFSPLYHYTTGTNLIDIINSGQLWGTQISCLNDTKELVHAVDLLRDAISEREKLAVSKDFALLLAKMREIISDPSPETFGAFVICFSERKDDLSQWRAYGGDDGGYAIEFDLEKLLHVAQENRNYLVPVTYDAAPKSTFMIDIMKWTETFFMEGINNSRAPTVEEWANEFAQCWLWSLSYLAPLLKHPSFKDEIEWRFIHFLRPEDVPNLRFKARQTIMTRHLPFAFSEPSADGYTPLPITGVTIGPKAHRRLSQIAVGDLLKSRGYASTVPTTLTDIPFRPAH